MAAGTRAGLQPNHSGCCGSSKHSPNDADAPSEDRSTQAGDNRRRKPARQAKVSPQPLTHPVSTSASPNPGASCDPPSALRRQQRFVGPVMRPCACRPYWQPPGPVRRPCRIHAEVDALHPAGRPCPDKIQIQGTPSHKVDIPKRNRCRRPPHRIVRQPPCRIPVDYPRHMSPPAAPLPATPSRAVVAVYVRPQD